MKKILRYSILLATICYTTAAKAQTITFDTKDHLSIDVYDTWEESPFRTGILKGNTAIVRNPQKDTINASPYVLAMQRSRYGSNTFGVRIELKSPFELTPTTQYVHLLIHKPYESKVMVVGLGKRTDRPAQSPETEQFWALTPEKVVPGHWQSVTLPIKGAGGIEIHSLVVVPDCTSPHHYTEDAICYIDAIEVNDNPQSTRYAENHTTAEDSDPTTCFVSNSNRNGEVTLPDGTQLINYEHHPGKRLRVKVRPEAGFRHDGITLHYADSRQSIHIPARKVRRNGMLSIPGKHMTGRMEIEGIFIESRHTRP